MKNAPLLTKRKAADLLGVSVSTFDRLRVRVGLQPEKTARIKPVLFDRTKVQDLVHNYFSAPGNDGILPLAEIKRRAGRKGVKR